MIAGATTIVASPPTCVGGHWWTLLVEEEERGEERRGGGEAEREGLGIDSKLKVRRVGRIRPEEEEALGWIRC